MAERALQTDVSAAETAVPWERVEKFVGQVAHDVRNGLNTLELQLTYLGEICVEPEAAEECQHLRKSLTSVAKQLQALRLSTCAPAPLPMEYPAADFFEDLRERFERMDGASAAKATWAFDLGKASVVIDPELTIGALLEVLGNALRFGGDAPEFTFEVQTTGAIATITIVERKSPDAAPIDTQGWGQPLQSTRRGAYGLGLFRATRVIESQGGTIGAVHSGPTLTTTITLPLAAAA